MKFLHKIVLSLALIFTASACFVYGNATGTITFFVLAAAFEILYWLNLFPSKKTG
ncbi:hypothetical protein [Parashewanella tropica]|uniref:hypothetical protein n=1 Tax=Parashewanella tropica TaxID=2547970 RepID=UPI00147822B0|nr:hypothetical protein [Parashewanella tropica]